MVLRRMYILPAMIDVDFIKLILGSHALSLCVHVLVILMVECGRKPAGVLRV